MPKGARRRKGSARSAARAMKQFRDACKAKAHVDVPEEIVWILEEPLLHRTELTAQEIQTTSNTVKRHGVYTQLARMLREKGIGKSERRPLPKYAFPAEVLNLVRGWWPGGVADRPSPPGSVTLTWTAFVEAFSKDGSVVSK